MLPRTCLAAHMGSQERRNRWRLYRSAQEFASTPVMLLVACRRRRNTARDESETSGSAGLREGPAQRIRRLLRAFLDGTDKKIRNSHMPQAARGHAPSRA